MGGSPAITASTIAQQATVFASGPTESSVGESGSTPAIGTRRAVGLYPTTPQHAAGMRHEPPVSVPIAASAMPSLIETAAPDELPPGTRPPVASAPVRSHGARGVPKCGLRPRPE